MKTIEERAYDYAEVTTWDDIDGYPSDIYATNAYNAYVEGAKEQKAIDDAKLLKLKSSWEKEAQINHDAEMHYKQGYHDAIEKACERLKEIVEGGVHPQSTYSFLDKFRKAMEE